MDLKEATALMRDGAGCRRTSWGDKEPTFLTLTKESTVGLQLARGHLRALLEASLCELFQVEERLDAVYVVAPAASIVCGFPLTYADIFADDWVVVLHAHKA